MLNLKVSSEFVVCETSLPLIPSSLKANLSKNIYLLFPYKSEYPSPDFYVCKIDNE